MRGTILYGPGDVRFEKRDDPKIVKPTDAIIKISATCVCGPDLWPYRGIQETTDRPGGSIGYDGVPHGVELNGQQLYFTHVRLHGGPAPVRNYLPNLIDLVLSGKINPGRMFDLTLPLDQVAEGYRAMVKS